MNKNTYSFPLFKEGGRRPGDFYRFKKSSALRAAPLKRSKKTKTRSVGIEPTAHGFGDHCSTDELRPYNNSIIIKSIL